MRFYFEKFAEGTIDIATWFGLSSYLALSIAVILLHFFALMPYFYYKTFQALGRDDQQNLSGGVARFRDKLKNDGRWRQTYVFHLNSALCWLSGGKEFERLGPTPWHSASYRFFLKMAVLYPMVSFFLIWFCTGDNVSGLSNFFPANTNVMDRIIILLAVVLYLVLFVLGILSKNRKSRKSWLFFAFAGAFVGSIAFAGTFVGADAILGAIAGIIAFAVAGIFVGAGAGAGTFVGAFAFVGAGASTPIFAVVASVVGAFAAAFSVTGVGAYAFMATSAFVGAGAIAGAFVGAVEYLDGQSMKRRWAGRFQSVVLIAATAMIFWASGINQILGVTIIYFDHQKLLLIFFCLLPLINAFFDWLSVGMTRWLLQGTVNSGGNLFFIRGFIDLIAAIFLLFVLILTTIAAIQFINARALATGHSEFFKLSELFGMMHQDALHPALYWVYFTLFSTLLPTFLHSLIASFSLITWHLPRSLRLRYVGFLESGFSDDYPRLIETTFFFSMRNFVGFALPTLVWGTIIYANYTHLSSLGLWLLNFCEWFAVIIAKMPAPVFAG